MSLFYGVVLGAPSSFAIILLKKSELVIYKNTLVFLMSCGCRCSVSLPRGAMCCSLRLCHSWSYSLVFY